MSSLPACQAGSAVDLTAALTDPSTGLPVDLTAAATLEFEALPPGGVLVKWAAAAVGDPTAGVMAYTTSATDCALAGIWRAQAHVVTAAGLPYRSDPDLMSWRVKANLPGA